jgi:hypothetical protein
LRQAILPISFCPSIVAVPDGKVTKDPSQKSFGSFFQKTTAASVPLHKNQGFIDQNPQRAKVTAPGLHIKPWIFALRAPRRGRRPKGVADEEAASRQFV